MVDLTKLLDVGGYVRRIIRCRIRELDGIQHRDPQVLQIDRIVGDVIDRTANDETIVIQLGSHLCGHKRRDRRACPG
jgi:hypothetical protein